MHYNSYLHSVYIPFGVLTSLDLREDMCNNSGDFEDLRILVCTGGIKASPLDTN